MRRVLCNSYTLLCGLFGGMTMSNEEKPEWLLRVPLAVEMEEVFIAYIDAKQGIGDEFHVHDSVHQIYIPLSGRFIVDVEGQSKELTPNDWAVMSAGTSRRSYFLEEQTRILLINFNRDFLQKVISEYTGEKKGVEFAPWGKASASVLQRMAESQIRLFLSGLPEQIDSQEQERQIANLFLTIHQGSYNLNGIEDFKVLGRFDLQKVLSFMKEHFKENLTLDVILKSCKISRSYLFRLFKEYLNTTPLKYLNALKLQYAERMLKQPQPSITDIAYECGFGSLSTFERLFKTTYGCTPSLYRFDRLV